MWVLLVMMMTVNGTVIAYDQGRYDNWSSCHDTGKAMVSELEGQYTYTCVEWK
jgi:hypothetical protein